jgi:endonuclease III
LEPPEDICDKAKQGAGGNVGALVVLPGLGGKTGNVTRHFGGLAGQSG